MKLTDLTDSYRLHFLDQNDPTAYEASAPDLFAHYHAHWSVPGRPFVQLSAEQLAAHRDLIIERLPYLEQRFAAIGLDTTTLEVIFMVGQGTSNGHSMLTPDGAAAWLDLEAYPNITRIDTFVTHEIAHALHYLRTPDFYFRSREEQKNPLRQLITEGLATYITCRALDCSAADALWADYLPADTRSAWMQQCRDRLPELCGHLLACHRAGDQTEMFYANDRSDILKYRAGYYLGLAVIEIIVSDSQLDASALLSTPRPDLERYILTLLHNMGTRLLK